MYQRVELIGNVTKDAEMRFTPSGVAVTSFTVAINEKYGEKESVIWVKVTTWAKQAEVCFEYVKKGMLIFIAGRLIAGEDGNPKVFTRNDGSAGSAYEIKAQDVKFLSRVGQREEANELEEVPF